MHIKDPMHVIHNILEDNEKKIAYNGIMFKQHAPTYSMAKVYQKCHTK